MPPAVQVLPPASQVTFYPDQMVDNMFSAVIVLCIISILTVFFPVTLSTVADPTTTPLGVRPEWYYLWLYAILHYVPTIVGVFLPVVATVALILLPWLDRNPLRHPRRRGVAMVMLVALLVSVTALTYLGAVKE